MAARGIRRDVFCSRTAPVVAHILALLGIEPGRRAIRHAYAQAPTRRLAVSRARGEIVAFSDANVAARRVSVLAPMGTALLGYRVGDAVEWAMPGGRRRLLVEEILYQPEAAGDEPKERSWREADGMCSVAGRRPW